MDRSGCSARGLGFHLEPMETSARNKDGSECDICDKREVSPAPKRMAACYLGDRSSEPFKGAIARRFPGADRGCETQLSPIRPILGRARQNSREERGQASREGGTRAEALIPERPPG